MVAELIELFGRIDAAPPLESTPAQGSTICEGRRLEDLSDHVQHANCEASLTLGSDRMKPSRDARIEHEFRQGESQSPDWLCAAPPHSPVYFPIRGYGGALACPASESLRRRQPKPSLPQSSIRSATKTPRRTVMGLLK